MGRPKKEVSSVTLSLRFEPKNKYLADVAARGKQQSLNRFIELAVEQALRLKDGTYCDEALWDEDPIRRFQLLAKAYPERLSFEEKHIWEVILADRTLSARSGELKPAAIAARWESLVREAETAKDEMVGTFLSQLKIRRKTSTL